MQRIEPADPRKTVKVGQSAVVSIRGRTHTLEVIAVGCDGITGRTDTGQQHHVRWASIRGSVGKPKDPPMVEMVKSVLFSDDDQRIRACAPPETTEQEVKRKIPAEVLAHHRRR
jgi:hypothetical protein